MGKKVTRLYEQFQPEHYGLHLILDRDAMRFSGTVTIRGRKVGRPSERLTFHQKDLKVSTATVIKHDKKGDHELKVDRINSQKSYDEVRLHAAEMVYPGEYSVRLEFKGTITKQMHGIYPCFFTHDGQDKKLIATQFESHHAREAFPCIDEPEAKATFDLTLTTPAAETVIANTPLKQQKTEAKQQITTFVTTPKMSVYLLAFVFGEMGYKEAKTKEGVVVRAYATPDNVKLTDHGLDVAVKGLEFFSDYFETPYPLPKLDIVALPDFSVGAMENWGLMTFRETTMLTDPLTSSIESRQLVALVVGHELSHQWFGDLVTMRWWDDLWLNESFANLMEYLVVDALYPEWRIWQQFVSHETASAKRRDSLADVQPIKTEVRHPDEISTLFDPSIVYAKGGTVLYMLMHYIGEAAFRKGLKAYFEKHCYGNTTADDLWSALSASSQQDIGGFMNAWLTRPGYPLVSVDWQPGSPQANLKQTRFLSEPSEPAPRDKPWPVPLAATQPLSEPLFHSAETSIEIKPNDDKPLLFNHDGYSYSLPHYTQPAHLQQIVQGIKNQAVDTIDRLLLLDNYIMLQRGGISSTTDLLELLPAYAGETSEDVWGNIALSIAEARKLVEGDEASETHLNKLISGLVSTLADRLGWDDQPDDTAQDLRLRGLIISLAAGAKVDSVINEGLRRFAQFEQPSDLTASTRGIVYFCGSRYGTPADFTKLLRLHDTIKSADEKEELAAGLTATKTPAHYQKLVTMLTTDAIRRQDLLHWYAWLLRNRYSRAAAWDWVKQRWDWIEEEFASEKNCGFFARFAGNVFSHPAELSEFQKFFGPKRSIVAMARDITLAEQEMVSRIAWRKRNEAAVKTWLKNNA